MFTMRVFIVKISIKVYVFVYNRFSKNKINVPDRSAVDLLYMHNHGQNKRSPLRFKKGFNFWYFLQLFLSNFEAITNITNVPAQCLTQLTDSLWVYLWSVTLQWIVYRSWISFPVPTQTRIHTTKISHDSSKCEAVYFNSLQSVP
jgi:hypothetical protein